MEKRKGIVVKDDQGNSWSLSIKQFGDTTLDLMDGHRHVAYYVFGEVVVLTFGNTQITLASYSGARIVEKCINGEQVKATEVDGVTYVNTMPFAFALLAADGTAIVFPRSITVRLDSTIVPTQELIGGVPLLETRPGNLVGLPDEEHRYIASMPEAQRAAALGYHDVVSPDSGSSLETGAIHNDKGQLVLAQALTRYVS